MYRTFKNLQNISASILNSHTTEKNGIISIGPIYYNGQSVILSNFIVVYNGIIVSEDSPTPITVGSDSQYIYVTNITAAPDSEPFIVASSTSGPGVCLARKVNGQWVAEMAEYEFTGREKEGNTIYSVYSNPEVGTIRIELRGLAYSPDFFFNQTIPVTLTTAKSDKESIIGSDGNNLYLYKGFQYNKTVNISGVNIFSIYQRESDCVFSYYNQGYIYVNTWDFSSNTVTQHYVFTISQPPSDIHVLNENELVVVLDDSIALYTSNGVQKGIYSAQKVHTLHGNIVFIKDGDIYFNFKKIKSLESIESIPYCCGEWFVEVFGTQYVIVLDGNKRTVLPLPIAIVPPKVLVCHDKMFIFSSINYSIYNWKTKTCSSPETGESPLCVFGDKYYNGYVSTSEIGVYIIENNFPYKKKEIIRQHAIDSLTVNSNSDVYCDRIGNLYIGVSKSGSLASVQPTGNVSFIDIFAHDFDYVLLSNDIFYPAFHCSPSGCITSSSVDGQIAFNILSGKIHVYYGQYNNVYINAINSIIVGAKINNLYIENCRNVLFIGCEISNIVDSNPGVNKYKVIGSIHNNLTGRSSPSCHPASAIDFISPQYNNTPLFMDTNIQDRINHIQEQVVGIANSTNGKFIYPITWIRQTTPTNIGSITIYVKTTCSILGLTEFMEREDTFVVHRDSSNNFYIKNIYTNIKYEDPDIFNDRMSGNIYDANDFIELIINSGVISLSYTYGTGNTESSDYLYSSIISVNEIYI